MIDGERALLGIAKGAGPYRSLQSLIEPESGSWRLLLLVSAPDASSIQSTLDDGTILSPAVWSAIKESVDRFYSEADSEEIVAHNYAALGNAFLWQGSDRKVSGFVYLMQAGDEYKIGWSAVPEKRAASLRQRKGQKAKLLCTIRSEYAVSLENALHQRFADKRLDGEWFKLDKADVQSILELGDAT